MRLGVDREGTYLLWEIDAMVDFMSQRYGLTRHNALGLASVVVDLHITQMVNQVCGVHAILPHEGIAELGLLEGTV